MWAKYQMLPDRVVIEYYDLAGKLVGGERIARRGCFDYEVIAYDKADAWAGRHGQRLERLTRI